MKSGLATGLLFLGAILAGLLAIYFANKYITNEVDSRRTELEKQYEKVDVVVLKGNLRAGTKLVGGHLASRPVPKAFIHRDAIRSSEFESIIDSTLLFPVNKGEPLLSTHVSNRTGTGLANLVSAGKRALAFPVDIESSLTGMLRPNDNIDLIMTITDGNLKKTLPLLPNVDVLATGERVDEFSQTSDTGRYQTITLLVTSEEAAKIIHAQGVSELSVVLRSSDDPQDTFSTPVTKDMLLGKVEKKKVTRRRAPSIEIIKGAN